MEKKSVVDAYMEYVNYLKSLGVNTDAPHWNTNKTKDWRTIKNKLLDLFKYNSCLDRGDDIHRNCSTRFCANPLHYTIVKIATMEKLENIDISEIEELSELVDVKLITKLGFKNYFRLFNSNNPLPAKVQDFYAACNIALRREGRKLLPTAVLTSNYRRNKCVNPRAKQGISCVNINKVIKENYSENEC